MSRYTPIFILLAASFTPALPLGATSVGAYWPFQTDQTGATFSETVGVDTWPNGNPAFSYTGTEKAAFANYGSAFTAHDGTTWQPGQSISWNANGQASTGNTFEISLDCTGVEAMSVRMKYRLNGVEDSGGLVSAFSAFEYSIDGGAFVAVPGVDLALVNDTNWNSEWTADLSAVSAIEDADAVTLRWTFPDLIQVEGTNIRVDDLEVTGTYSAPVSNRVRHFPERPYNVLFIAVDDLKPMLGAYGDSIIQTPNMDTLAESGLTFTNAHCQQAICNASRVSMMTGLRVDTTKTWELSTYFRDTVPTVVTLPQHFKNNGYTTKAIGKIFHSTTAAKHDVANSWSDGYTHQSSGGKKYYGTGPTSAVALAEDAGDNVASSTDRGVYQRDGVTPVNDQSYTDGRNSDYAITKLAEYAAAYDDGNGTPFFLALGFQKPHLPFNSPDAYWALYDDYMDPAHPDYVDDFNLASYTGLADAKKLSVPMGSLPFTAPFAGEPSSYSDTPTPPTAEDARRLIHGYMACVSYIDTLMGEVLEALEAEGLADSTIIVLWGDHGWHLNDHDGWWSKHTNYEQATRSPLIVSVPGMAAFGTAGKKSHTPMELIDVYPTLLDLCGLPMSPQPVGFELEGTSFMPLLEDVDQPWKKAAFSQYHRTVFNNSNTNLTDGTSINYTGKIMGYSLRTERYRYTEWWAVDATEVDGNGIILDYDEKLKSTPEFVELYDYALDPDETVNVADDIDYATVKSELSALLDEGNGWSQDAVAPPFNYPETVAEWQSSYLIPSYAAADLHLDADPDGDGIENIFEYITGKSPFYPDPAIMVSSLSGGDLVVEYDHVTSRGDVTLSATTVDTLSSEAWSSNGVTETVVEPLPNRTRKRARIPIEASGAFLRLEAHHAPTY